MQKEEVKWFLTTDKAFTFYCNVELKERGRQRERENQLSEEIALRSPSSLQVCFSLLLSWMSTIRHAQLDSCQMCGLALGLLPTGDWALSCMCVCVCTCVCIYLCVWKKLTSFPYKELPTQNDRCQQTNMHTHTHTIWATDTQFKAQLASGSGLQTAHTY